MVSRFPQRVHSNGCVCGRLLDAGFYDVAANREPCAVSRVVRNGTKYCSGSDSGISGACAGFPVHAISGTFAGVEPDCVDDSQRELSRAVHDFSRAEGLAQYVPGFHAGRGRVYDNDDALLGCRHNMESARGACFSPQPPRELKTNENLPV
jgi:hypothetical protein